MDFFAFGPPMLWLKAFHIIFVVTWFAGLFYLPRLFVYHVEAAESAIRERLKVMERRLLGITHIGGALALGFGLATLAAYSWHNLAYLQQGWLHAKLALVAALIAYHVMLARMVRQFARDANTRSSRWLRVFNEAPALLLVAIVLLVVLKP
ncbi:CopD family protein [Dokdonella sp.]|uniref:CopD family protein n=1 Tax=Dokdonella sp. TaxID=2291710 RepID=UPI0025B8DCAF|nr:CopD family protein [Dokdonella sp.]